MKRLLLHTWNLLFLAAFVLSAVVQYNDPDPLLWMIIYGLAGLCCLLFALGRLPRWVPPTMGAVTLLWMLTLLPGIFAGTGHLSPAAVFGSAAMLNTRVELVRELGGLLIILFWMFVLIRAQRRPRPL